MIEQIRKQILKDTGILVIPANTIAKKPPLPYATVNLTSPWIDDKGHADIVVYQDETGHHMKRTEAYQMGISFQVYAATDAEAVYLAKMIRSWFSLRGESFMDDLNLVVVHKGNIENRTTFLVDSYDYKHGFDIHLRGTEGQDISRPAIVIPDDAVKNPDGTVTFPDGTVNYPDGSIEYPDGTITEPVGYDWIEKVEIEFKGVE